MQSAQNTIIKCPPYDYTYYTFAKQRWLGRKYIDVLSSEFKDYDRQYFEKALERGQIQILRSMQFIHNKDLDVIDSDIILHFIHRHEAPVFAMPKVEQTQLVVERNGNKHQVMVIFKPAGMPVQPSSHFNKHSIRGFMPSFKACNRLDKLVSGYMIGSESQEAAGAIAELIGTHQIFKAYLARIRNPENSGIEYQNVYMITAPLHEQFANEDELHAHRVSNYPEIVCQEHSASRVGKWLYKIEGKEQFRSIQAFFSSQKEEDRERFALTLIARTALPDVVVCSPVTGRTHQLRIHLSSLGSPIVDDPLYGGDINLIRASLVNILPSREELLPAQPELLREDAEKKLRQLKALRHKDVKGLLEKMVIPEGLECPVCSFLESAMKEIDTSEDPLQLSNGIIKILQPYAFTQPSICLHCFAYALPGSSFYGDLPPWISPQEREAAAIQITAERIKALFF